MAVTNVFRPSTLGFNAYGWKGSSLYNRADVPTQWVKGANEQDRVVIEQQLAYEWLNSNFAGDVAVGGVSTNPPFLSGAAGRLMPGLRDPLGGGPPRILRGFIRRAESDVSDPTSMARLYFMFNPETITRDYVSYLDQGALDPFNTVFQSGNLVAPPSYMDFTFSLLFDRQEECSDPTHPGVFVDYQYFDLVVRNVIPTSDPNAMNSALPDNGVMMVNPRDITVIFSPQITIQGRPSNARVSFQRFTHRMVPTRMQIDLTMRVIYFGPMKDMTAYVKETDVTAATVPNDAFTSPVTITQDDLARWNADLTAKVSEAANTIGGVGGPANAATPVNYPTGTPPATMNISDSSIALNKSVMDAAKAKVALNHTVYKKPPYSPWASLDCSGLVYTAFKDAGKLDQMGWSSLGGGVSAANLAHAYAAKLGSVALAPYATMAIIVFCPPGLSKDQRKTFWDAHSPYLAPGDLLFRVDAVEREEDHVAFFSHWENATITGKAGKPFLFDAASASVGVGTRGVSYSNLYDYTSAMRPLTSLTQPT